MAYRIEWQDERGACIERYAGIEFRLNLNKVAPAGSACLRFIDSYGNTIFNLRQIAALENELLDAYDRATESELAEQLAELLKFVRLHKGHMNRYLKFTGA